MHEKTPKSYDIDSNNGYSPPRKKKHKKDRVTVSKLTFRN